MPRLCRSSSLAKAILHLASLIFGSKGRGDGGGDGGDTAFGFLPRVAAITTKITANATPPRINGKGKAKDWGGFDVETVNVEMVEVAPRY